jgi:hypothetical protein
MTLFLAIWGAAVATLVGLSQLLTFVRDRPKIEVSVTLSIRADQPPTLVIHVANHGRQPVTITKAAFVVAAGEYTFTNVTKGLPPVSGLRPEIPLLRDDVVLLPPGEVRQFAWVIAEWPRMVFADFPLRAYVVDPRGRTSWGPAGAFLREVINSGVPAPPGGKPECLQPPPDMRPLVPDPVARPWELWKPRTHRRPQLPPEGSKQWPRAAA